MSYKIIKSKGSALFLLQLIWLSFAQAQTIFKADLLDSIILYETKNREIQQSIISLANSGNYDLQYASINLSPSLSNNFISGKIKYRFNLLKTSSFIEFDASDNLIITNVKWHNTNLIFTHSDNILSINFPASQNPQSDSIEIEYQGNPNATGLGSYNEDKHGEDSVKVVWTLSQPYGSRDWMPCKMTLTDKIDSSDIKIEVDSGFMGVSNGLLLGAEILPNGKSIFHWSQHYPIATYLIAFAVTNYDTFHLTANTQSGIIPLHFYHFPESKDEWKQDAIHVQNCMTLFDSLFGNYPFPRDHYGETQFMWGGGMEHQTNSFMYNLWFELVAHELAHQWFGDKITCGSWQDIWLNEGFATYLAGLAYENIQPIYWNAYLQTIGRRATSIEKGSVFVSDTNNVSRIFSGALSYSKGAYVLHMLRWKIGDSLFYGALNNYLHDPNLEFGFSATSDLKFHIEQITGNPIDDFFEKWVYGSGYPSYTALWSQKNNNVKIKLLQATSDPESVSFFDFKVEIRIKGQFVDSIIKLDHSFSGQEFELELSSKIDTVLIDPNLWILSKNNKTIKLPDVDDKKEFYLFPNPVTDELNLIINPEDKDFKYVKLISSNGKVAAIHEVKNLFGKISINTSGIQSGNYVCAIFSSKRLISSKSFVKQ